MDIQHPVPSTVSADDSRVSLSLIPNHNDYSIPLCCIHACIELPASCTKPLQLLLSLHKRLGKTCGVVSAVCLCAVF